MWFSPSNSAAPPPGAGPPGVSPVQQHVITPMQSGGAPEDRVYGRTLQIHVDTLCDMPRDYVFRRPKSYVVKAIANDLEHVLAVTSRIDGHQGWTADKKGDDVETIDLGPAGIMDVETEADLIYMQVEYDDGTFIGRCHIHRKDNRSTTTWPYMLSDDAGNGVNCGIQLHLVENARDQRGALPPQSMLMGPPQTVYAGQPPVLFPGPQQEALPMASAVVTGVDRNRDGIPDFLQQQAPLKVGDTVTVTQNAEDMDWSGLGNDMRKNQWVKAGEVKVVAKFDSSGKFFAPPDHDLLWIPVGAAMKAGAQFPAPQQPDYHSYALQHPDHHHHHSHAPHHPDHHHSHAVHHPDHHGHALHQRQKKIGPLFGPLPNLMELVRPGRTVPVQEQQVAHVPAHGPPAHVAPTPTNVTNVAMIPKPTSIATVPTPVTSAVTYTYTYDLPVQPQNWRVPAIERGNGPQALRNGGANDLNDYNHPGAYLIGQDHGSAHDGMTELWCAPPEASWADEFFGSDQDLEVKALYNEPWDRPLDPYDPPLFVEDHEMFPDMDLQVIEAFRNPKQAESENSQNVQIVDRQQVAARAKQKLPELAFDRWVDPKPQPPARKALPAPAPKDKLKDAPPSEKQTPAQKPVENKKIGNPQASGKIHAEISLIGDDQQLAHLLADKRFSRLDDNLIPGNFEVQVIGRFPERGEKHDAEKHAWLRTPRQAPTSAPEGWLKHFDTDELRHAVSCRAGHRGKKSPLPNQDNFSMTKSNLDIALYVVCDGHGPLGHVAAFRVAQSLPKYTFDLLSSPSHLRPKQTEKVLMSCFEDANKDLQNFAQSNNLDMTSSGAACTAVLRNRAEALVAWVGDCGALLGTVTENGQRVDLVTQPHKTTNQKELERVRHSCQVTEIYPHNVGRLFRRGAGTKSPGGADVTRSFGDFAVAGERGITVHPDFKKTSFDAIPGVVLLASGGLWDVLPEGERTLNVLTKCGLRPFKAKHHHATAKLCQEARAIWAEEEPEHWTDDVTCILLHWEKPVEIEQPPPPPMPPPPQIEQSPPRQPPRDTFGPNDLDIRIGPSSTARESRRETGDEKPKDALAASADVRVKPTIPNSWLDSLEEVEPHLNNPALAQPDPALGHRDILAQVVSCIETHEAFGTEKSVWFSEKGEPRPLLMESNSKEDWLRKFQVGNIQVATTCRRGQPSPNSLCPNQDNYSITSASGNRAIYVVCDGHGFVGHLVSFRVAQTLPVFILDGLSANAAHPERAMSKAFHKASEDLAIFAQKHDLNLFDSGTACSVVLRQGDRVLVAWLGDCRALVATVVNQDKRVDLMSPPHAPSNPSEQQRLSKLDSKLGLTVHTKPGGPARIYMEDKTIPGLSISRALGDLAVSSRGVICDPDMTKTSFTGVPGLVFVASGGLCEFFRGGEAMLERLVDDGELLSKGPDHALRHLYSTVVKEWQVRCGAYCEDMCGILIQWLGPGITTTSAPLPVGTSLAGITATPTPLPVGTSQIRVAPEQALAPVSVQYPSRAVASQRYQTSTAGSQPQVIRSVQSAQLGGSVSRSGSTIAASPSITGHQLSPDRIIQAGHSLPPRMAPSVEATSSKQVVQMETRKFLDAQPRGSVPGAQQTPEAEIPVQAPEPSGDASQGTRTIFLDAAPRDSGRKLTTVIESTEAFV